MLIENSESPTLKLVKIWIEDLVNTGMSYARISTRLGLSPSAIQKIVYRYSLPSKKTLRALADYYMKIFEMPQSYNQATMTYFAQNETRINNILCETKNVLTVLT